MANQMLVVHSGAERNRVAVLFTYPVTRKLVHVWARSRIKNPFGWGR